MKKFLTRFFVVLGVVFFILILMGVYLFVADPLNLKPLFGVSEDTGVSEMVIEEVESGEELMSAPESENNGESVDSNPLLNENQEAVLERVGIDPADVPGTITPEQEACLVDIVGQGRADEIRAGATPTALEVLRGSACL